MTHSPHHPSSSAFTYPLAHSSSVYDELGLDATATDRQLGAAVTARIQELDRDAASVTKNIDDATAAIPGYKDVLAKHAAALETKAPAGVLAELKSQLAKMQEAALSRFPDLERKREQLRQLQTTIKKWRDLCLDTPEQREKYERMHPPLALLKLRDCSPTDPADRRATLQSIRKEVAAFLEARGEIVFHPSDLTRDDFRGDYQPHDLLDPPEDSE